MSLRAKPLTSQWNIRRFRIAPAPVLVLRRTEHERKAGALPGRPPVRITPGAVRHRDPLCD